MNYEIKRSNTLNNKYTYKIINSEKYNIAINREIKKTSYTNNSSFKKFIFVFSKIGLLDSLNRSIEKEMREIRNEYKVMKAR